jgi:hypothetical protein
VASISGSTRWRRPVEQKRAGMGGNPIEPPHSLKLDILQWDVVIPFKIVHDRGQIRVNMTDGLLRFLCTVPHDRSNRRGMHQYLECTGGCDMSGKLRSIDSEFPTNPRKQLVDS